MRRIYISLSEVSLQGFDHRTTTSLELAGTDVVVFADSLASGLNFLTENSEYRQALVITLADEMAYANLETDLGHLQVTNGMLPGLHGTAAALLAARSTAAVGETPRISQLRFLRSLERVDQTIREAGNFEQLMSEVLQSVLDILQCDRAWLLFPCDPEAKTWRVPMMRTGPQYSHDEVMEAESPTDSQAQAILQATVASGAPVGFGGANEQLLPAVYTEAFGIQTQLLTALYPKQGQPWALGVHQCSSKRLWTDEDRQLLAEVGERLTVALSNMLYLRELKANEERWRSLTMHSPDHVMLVDFDGTIRFINYTVPDLTVEQVLGTVVYTYMDPEFHQVAADCFKQVAATQKVGKYETTYCGDGDGVMYFETLVAPVLDEGEATALLLHSRDITARVLAEEATALASSNLEQERSMFLAGPVVVFKWRNEDNWPVAFVSPNVREVIGYSTDELVSGAVSYAGLIPPEDVERVVAEVATHTDNGAMMFSHEPYRILHKDGRTIWVHDQTTIVRGDDGQVTHYLGYLVDVTDRIKAEEGRLSLERQMLHAQKLESLGVLAGGIAHDFNNLLVAILGNAELAMEHLSPMSPALDMIHDIDRAAVRAADLAKQMLAYSGKGRFVIEPIFASELLGEMAHLLEVATAKNVVLKYELAENLPTFGGDVTQVRQVAMNLITNASEAIGDEGGVVSLSTGVMECDRAYLDSTDNILGVPTDGSLPVGTYVFFEVTDTGAGMTAETLTKVFDPFYTTKFTGRGLGMSAVLGIVRGHSGVIRVSSGVGRGSTFRVLFPASAESAATDPGNEEKTDDRYWRGTGTVLVIDDEESVRTVAGRMLAGYGFKVLQAEDGRQGVDVFRSHVNEIVCVLLDLTMPRMGGEDTFNELRRICSEVPVVLCSGFNEQDVTQNFTSAGLAGFIQKPFKINALREAMRVALT